MQKVIFTLSILMLSITSAHAEFIYNGNFSLGNVGFSTDYAYTPGNIGAAKTYDVLSNPYPAHGSATSFGDHTTGTGLMMAVNEAGSQSIVWKRSVSVLANREYDFSLWTASWTSSNPSRLDVLFNGISMGNAQAPSSTGVWERFSRTWNSGASTNLTIELKNLTTADIGGDFALDDISLVSNSVSVPEPSTLVLLAPTLGFAMIRRIRRSVSTRVIRGSKD